MSDADLLQLVIDKIISGGRETSAVNLREVLNDFISNKQNIDGKDAANGYAGLDGSGKVLDSALPLKKGKNKFNGDGVNKDFLIAHNLGTVPDGISLTPTTIDAAASFYVQAVDAKNMTVRFLAAPAGGVNNVELSWIVI